VQPQGQYFRPVWKIAKAVSSQQASERQHARPNG
jgi:hypothetical protein